MVAASRPVLTVSRYDCGLFSHTRKECVPASRRCVAPVTLRPERSVTSMSTRSAYGSAIVKSVTPSNGFGTFCETPNAVAVSWSVSPTPDMMRTVSG